jgi:hypothetical protein
LSHHHFIYLYNQKYISDLISEVFARTSKSKSTDADDAEMPQKLVNGFSAEKTEKKKAAKLQTRQK